jgi:hypothetical protein
MKPNTPAEDYLESLAPMITGTMLSIPIFTGLGFSPISLICGACLTAGIGNVILYVIYLNKRSKEQ